jgi:predicted ATPase/class 3 adenylate cyclase
MGAGGHRQLPSGTVTFLFTDIEGSTRLLTALGERYAAVLDNHASILRKAITAHGGIELGTEGDSFFAVFPSAIGAIEAVADSQRGLAAADWPTGTNVKVRMGLHSGEGRLGGDNYVGMDVHVGARIAAAGHGGQVVVSHTTHALAEQGLPAQVTFRELGEHHLKDLEGPVRLFQLDIGGLPTDFPPLKAIGARRHNLPEQLTSFIGRDREMATVAELLDGHRLVTLTGPGGAGKTRLAQQVARAKLDGFADGVTFVELAAIQDPALVPLAVARALRVDVDPGGDAIRAAVAHLRDRELLMVLDNFEQVADAHTLVEQLLAEARALKILVTSREPLGIYGEREYEVPPFEDVDSIDLFADRARAISPGFVVTDANAEAVAAIVAHVDGLPLAVELAASQVRILSPAALRERLEQHLPLPSADGRGRPERQRTMRDAIGWSYELLTEPERHLFAELAALPGGFSIRAAEALASPDLGITALEGVAKLVGKSLLRRTETPDGELRFGMLEPIREYAEHRLSEDFDAEGTSRRLAAFFRGFAEEAAAHLTMEDQGIWLDRCDREAPNVRRSLDWTAEAGETDIGLRIATALWPFWNQRGPMWEGRRILDRLLAAGGGSGTVRGRALGAAGGLAWWGGDFAAARRHFDEALTLLEHGEDRLAEAEALYNVGFAVLWQTVLGGDTHADRAEDLFRRSLAIAEELGDRRIRAKALRGLGQLRGVARGDASGAVPTFRESLALAEEIGDRWEMNESVIAVGNGLRFSGDLAGAKRAYLYGIDIMAEASNRQVINGLLFLLTALESQMGQHERVVRLWGAAEASREASGAIAPPSGPRLIGDPIAAARTVMSDEAVDRGLAEGRAMDHATVIAFAHDDGVSSARIRTS